MRFLWKLHSHLIERLTNPGLPWRGTMVLRTGFRVPEPPEGLKESRDLAHAHPELAKRFLLLKSDFEAQTGKQLIVTHTYRSPEVQFALFQKGRELAASGEWVKVGAVVTNCDGVTRKGNHNYYPSRAIDCAVDVDPGPGVKVSWDSVVFDPLGPLALKHGLIWGGSWTRFPDRPHLEISREIAEA